MSREDFYIECIELNSEREGKNLLVGSGPRKDTVIIDCSSVHLRYAVYWQKQVSIIEICLIEGRKDYTLPFDYFDLSAIAKANKET